MVLMGWIGHVLGLALLSVASLPASGCGGVAVVTEEEPIPTFETSFWGGVAPTRWFLLVVDDAPTWAARRLRERLADDLHGYFDDLDAADCGIRADPAVYRPVDLRLIVVGSSGTLEPRFRDSDGLHALGVDASPALLAAFEQAGREAILAMETPEVLPFVGQFELVHYLNVFEGKDETRSSVEDELVEAMPPRFGVWPSAALAQTRPDLSPPGPDVRVPANLLEVRLLDWPEDGSCPSHTGPATAPAFAPLDGVWTSPDCFGAARIFEVDSKDACPRVCMPRLPVTDPNGHVACRVYGEFPIHVDCEEKPGWTYLSSPESVLSDWKRWDVNLCELRQAEGPALTACIRDFSCSGCEPSFCFRRRFITADATNPGHQRPTATAEPLDCEGSGAANSSWERFRIVQGADQVDGTIRVVCEE